MRKVIKYWNEKVKPFHGEVNNEPTKTIPDEALTVQQILLNFTRGTLPPVSKRGQYADEEFNEHLLNEDSPLDDSINDLSYLDDTKGHINSLLDAQNVANHQKEEETRETSSQDVVNPPERETEANGE